MRAAACHPAKRSAKHPLGTTERWPGHLHNHCSADTRCPAVGDPRTRPPLTYALFLCRYTFQFATLTLARAAGAPIYTGASFSSYTNATSGKSITGVTNPVDGTVTKFGNNAFYNVPFSYLASLTERVLRAARLTPTLPSPPRRMVLAATGRRRPFCSRLQTPRRTARSPTASSPRATPGTVATRSPTPPA